MSYERIGFDPTNTDSSDYEGVQVEHLKFQKLGVHIVDAAKIIKKSASEPVSLVDSGFSSSMYYGMDAIRMTADVAPRSDSDKPSARVYQGRILLSPSSFPRSVYFADHTAHDDFAEATIHDLGDKPNHKRITDTTGTFSIALIYKPRKSSIHLSNEYPLPGSGRAHLPESFPAPANKRVRDKRAQLGHYINSLIIGAHLASNLSTGDIRPLDIDELIITPDGPLYRHPVSGEYVHNLKREVAVLSAEDRSAALSPFGSLPRPGKKRTPPGLHPEGQSEESTFKVPSQGLDSLYGIDTIKTALQPIIAYYKHPDIMKQWNIERPAAGILLQGPAGTGKTSIIRALAHEIGAKLREVDPSNVSKPYIGHSELAMKEVFESVRDATEPTIVFFDELDASISSSNSGRDTGAHVQNAVAAIFKKETGNIANSNPNVMFAAATNFPERIDEGLIRSGRFDITITVDLPNTEARTDMLRNLIIEAQGTPKDTPFNTVADINTLLAVSDAGEQKDGRLQDGYFTLFTQGILDDGRLRQLAATTEGYTGADLKNLLRQVKLSKALIHITTGHMVPITVQDLCNHATAMRRS